MKDFSSASKSFSIEFIEWSLLGATSLLQTIPYNSKTASWEEAEFLRLTRL